MKVFADTDLSEHLRDRLGRAEAEINNEQPAQILNVNEVEYVEYLVGKYQVDPIEFDWDAISISESEQMIPAEYFPGFRFSVQPGRRYQKQVISYCVPFRGDSFLLRCVPSSRILWTTDVDIKGSEISFDVVNWSDDPEEIRKQAESIRRPLQQQSSNVKTEVEAYNSILGEQIERMVRRRKSELLKRAGVLESLGVPLKKVGNVPQTFAIPHVKKKLRTKPVAGTKVFAPEPTLDESHYQEILRICSDVGIEMERHPSIYFDKDEETLRDHFLMVLASHFESVTGETFNKRGKTDILVRHENSNVFVAECKIWVSAQRRGVRGKPLEPASETDGELLNKELEG